jgi:hypothetical protein
MTERRPAPLSNHLRQRSHDRSFDIFDVRRALETGAICVDSWDDRYQNWKYRVVGVDIEGEALSVIVVLQPAQGVITVVTAY